MILDVISLIDNVDIIGLVEVAIIVFSLVLFGLSINAYRSTGLKKLIFAAVAFALFAVQLFIEYANDAFDIFNGDQTDLVISIIVLFTLMMFFLAVVRRN